MNNQQLLIFGDTLRTYGKTFFGLGAGFCYFLAGHSHEAYAAFNENQEPNRKSQNLGKLVADLNAKCENRSLLDKLKSQRENPNLLAYKEPVEMIGTDGCPGTLIPAGNSFTDSGTTIGANNTVTAINGGCSTYTTVAGPDVIYRFTLPVLAARTPTCSITVTPSGGTYDTAIYILRNTGTACPAGTGNAVTNCATGSDVTATNNAEIINDGQLDSLPAGTYYLFIDSFYTTAGKSSGPYSLSFNCTTVSPTAASVSVSGQVISPNGTGLSRVAVSSTDSNGQTRYTATNSFGYYKFEGLRAGEVYLFEVSSKKYQFSNPTQVVSVSDNIADLNFNVIE